MRTAKTDETGLIPRLICLRWAHSHLVGFVVLRLIYQSLKIIYKGSFKSFVALCADRICSDQHFVENCIEKFPSV